MQKKRRQFLYDHGYTITIKSDWEEYVKDTPIIDDSKQEQLVQEVENELDRRQTKRTDGKSEVPKKAAAKEISHSEALMKKMKKMN